MVGAFGMSLLSVIYVITHAIVGEITPAGQRGALLAIGNAIGTMADLLAPYVSAAVWSRTPQPRCRGFNRGFVVCGMVMFAGGIIGMLFMRPERDARRLAMAQIPVGAVTLAKGLRSARGAFNAAKRGHEMDHVANDPERPDAGQGLPAPVQLSRTMPPATLTERLDRLARLRALVADR